MLWLFRGREKERERRDELLSAYLDGELSVREQVRFEARLADAPELRAELEALRHTVSLVRDLPSVTAPRNFILSQSMVQRPQPVPAPQPHRAWAAPLLTAATAVVSLLFAVVLIGDLLLPTAGGLATAPQPMLQMEEAPEIASQGSPMADEAEAERGEAPTVTAPPAPTIEAMLEGEEEEPAASAAEEELSPEEATRAGEAPLGAGGTPPPEANDDGPTEEALEIAPTEIPTVVAKAVVTPTIPPAETPGPKEGVGIVAATPEEPLRPTPPAINEGERGLLGAERRVLPRLLPWRVLEVALGLAALGLTFATIRAWRARRP